jgi:flagellin-like hook-associated protein FlgL
MSKLEELKKKKEEISKIKKEVEVIAKEAFFSGVKDLFKNHEDLAGIKWSQYTPYFNDGDSCEFGSHNHDANIILKSDDESLEEADCWHERANDAPAVKAAVDFMVNFDDDDMYALFGDHVQVTVSEKGVEVEDYEHD